MCTSLPRLRSAQFERSSAIRPPALSRTSSRSARTRFNPTLDASRRANSTSPRFGNTSGLPRVELAEVLIEVDSWTGFTQFFRHAGGARSRNPDLVRHVYAAILAQACNFGLTTMADIADLTYRQLAWTTDWYLREETLKAAFSALVDFHSTSCLLPRPGAVEPSPPPMASDSPFEARRRTRPRSRNISASEGASLSTPGPRTSTRSTGRRSSRLRFVTRPMSSTRSSITRPIFRSSSTRRTPLATPRSSSPCFIFWGCSSPPASGTWALSACIVSMLLRVAGSLKLGWVTASLLISKLQAGARENVLSRALRDLGLLVKTQFILRWIENPDYRRRIHRQLNKGEALHALLRFLFFAHQGKVQRRQADQQTNQVLCLNLVTNAIVTWNTVYMNAAIERLRAEGRIGRDIDLGHLSPALYGHVNPYGKYRFEIEGRAPSLRPLRSPGCRNPDADEGVP